MKGLLFLIAILLFGIIALVCLVLDIRLFNRYRRNALIQKMVSDITVSMLDKLDKTEVSDWEPMKMIAENTTVFGDCIISQSSTLFGDCIISQSSTLFFHYEHMQLLRTVRERRVMAYAIVAELKKRIEEENKKKGLDKGSSYKLKSQCCKGSEGNKSCYSAHIFCYIANEHYVCAKAW